MQTRFFPVTAPARLAAFRFACTVSLCLAFLLPAGPAIGEQMLLTLSVESNAVKWQQEFVLTLTIYNSPDSQAPQISIDGLDQFLLRGTGKNLLQVPRGQTQKWIFTYTLTATEEGSFKVGPARTTVGGRAYYSNFLFIHVGDAPRTAPKKAPVEAKEVQQQPAVKPSTSVKPPAPEKKRAEPAIPEKKPVEKKTEPPPQPPKEEPKLKETVTVPVVLSAAEVKEKIDIVFDARKSRPYQSEGVPVVLKLLSQLPVEDLRLQEDPQFAGFLKYDLPFTTKPKGEKVEHKGSSYVSYDLLNFLVFPLEEGKITIPAVTCKMKVRVPSGKFRDADLLLNVEKSSNSIAFQVKPVPDGTVVGDFALRNEIITDGPQSKVVRFILEGKGQLSTFEFPELAGPQFRARNLSSSASASPRGETLLSMKSREIGVTPATNRITSIVLPPVQVRQFNPLSGKETKLVLPALSLRFVPPGPQVRPVPAFPRFQDLAPWTVAVLALIFTFLLLGKNLRPQKKRETLRLSSLFRRKNLKLHISRSAARTLYQQISKRITAEDGKEASLIEALKRHLPLEEWLKVERAFRALESTAYSPFKTSPMTYLEMKQICEKVELSWQR